MKRFSHLSFRGTLAALVLVLALPLVVFADQVVNNIDTTIDPALETKTITAGGSATVGFYIQPSNTIPPGDATGCNATGANPATVTLSVPAGVTASPTSLTFTGCGIVQNVTFSSSAVGSYNISVASVTGGKSGSLWDAAPAAFTLIVNPPPDTTPPVIVPTVSPAPNANGWNNTNVTVSWSVSDPESGIASSSGCGMTTLTTETAGTTLTCSATNGVGLSNSASVAVKIDKTAPTASASASPAPNANGWNNTDVVVTFSGTDALSGVDLCSVPVTLSDEGAGQSASGTCTDKAGNVSAPATASGINIDKTKPTLAPVVSPNPVYLGESATATANASDSLSGIDSESWEVPDTGSVGLKTVICTATDKAGNTATASATYRVIYRFTGFFRPVDNLPTLNVAKAGSAVPVKFSLSGNQGLSIFAAGYPKSMAISCNSTASTDGVEETVTAGGSSLNYDASADQYIYVWKTDKAWTGCRQLVVKLNDGMEYQANFKFSK